MTKRQNAKHEMHNTMDHFFKKEEAVVNTFPAFKAAVKRFTAAKNTFHDTAVAMARVITGITAEKKAAKKALADHFSEACGIVYSYAFLAGDIELMADVDYTHSALLRMRDSDVFALCGYLYQEIGKRLNDLKEYGIDETEYVSLGQTLQRFTDTRLAPRGAVAERGSYRLSIKRQMKELDDLFDSVLDRLALRFRKTHPRFYEEYLLARIIIDPAHTTTSVTGTLTDGNGEPLPGVTVQAEQDGKVFTAITNYKGQYIMKIGDPGTYLLTFHKEGYLSPEPRYVDIILGKRLVEDVALMVE